MAQTEEAERLMQTVMERDGLAPTRANARLLAVALGLVHKRVLDRRVKLSGDEGACRKVHTWMMGEHNPSFEGTVALLDYLDLLTVEGRTLLNRPPRRPPLAALGEARAELERHSKATRRSGPKRSARKRGSG